MPNGLVNLSFSFADEQVKINFPETGCTVLKSVSGIKSENLIERLIQFDNYRSSILNLLTAYKKQAIPRQPEISVSALPAITQLAPAKGIVGDFLGVKDLLITQRTKDKFICRKCNKPVSQATLQSLLKTTFIQERYEILAVFECNLKQEKIEALKKLGLKDICIYNNYTTAKIDELYTKDFSLFQQSLRTAWRLATLGVLLKSKNSQEFFLRSSCSTCFQNFITPKSEKEKLATYVFDGIAIETILQSSLIEIFSRFIEHKKLIETLSLLELKDVTGDTSIDKLSDYQKIKLSLLRSILQTPKNLLLVKNLSYKLNSLESCNLNNLLKIIFQTQGILIADNNPQIMGDREIVLDLSKVSATKIALITKIKTSKSSILLVDELKLSTDIFNSDSVLKTIKLEKSYFDFVSKTSTLAVRELKTLLANNSDTKIYKELSLQQTLSLPLKTFLKIFKHLKKVDDIKMYVDRLSLTDVIVSAKIKNLPLGIQNRFLLLKILLDPNTTPIVIENISAGLLSFELDLVIELLNKVAEQRNVRLVDSHPRLHDLNS